MDECLSVDGSWKLLRLPPVYSGRTYGRFAKRYNLSDVIAITALGGEAQKQYLNSRQFIGSFIEYISKCNLSYRDMERAYVLEVPLTQRDPVSQTFFTSSNDVCFVRVIERGASQEPRALLGVHGKKVLRYTVDDDLFLYRSLDNEQREYALHFSIVPEEELIGDTENG